MPVVNRKPASINRVHYTCTTAKKLTPGTRYNRRENPNATNKIVEAPLPADGFTTVTNFLERQGKSKLKRREGWPV
jgi:hypothetical protein